MSSTTSRVPSESTDLGQWTVRLAVESASAENPKAYIAVSVRNREISEWRKAQAAKRAQARAEEEAARLESLRVAQEREETLRKKLRVEAQKLARRHPHLARTIGAFVLVRMDDTSYAMLMRLYGIKRDCAYQLVRRGLKHCRDLGSTEMREWCRGAAVRSPDT